MKNLSAGLFFKESQSYYFRATPLEGPDDGSAKWKVHHASIFFPPLPHTSFITPARHTFNFSWHFSHYSGLIFHFSSFHNSIYHHEKEPHSVRFSSRQLWILNLQRRWQALSNTNVCKLFKVKGYFHTFKSSSKWLPLSLISISNTNEDILKGLCMNV